MIKHTVYRAISSVLAIASVSSIIFLASCNKKEEEEWVQYCYCEKCYEEARIQHDKEHTLAANDVLSKTEILSQAIEVYNEYPTERNYQFLLKCQNEFDSSAERVKGLIEFDYADYLRLPHD